MARLRSHLKARPRQARSEETLRRVLAAATRLLERMHFEDITIGQILELSGVSAGSFYARFRSKEDVLPQLYAAYSDDLRARVSAVVAPERWVGRRLAERLQELMRLAVAAYRERRGLLRAVALLARARPRAVARTALREREDQYRAAIALILECRDEIRHPDPATAVPLAVLMALATCRDKVLFAEAPHPASVAVSDEQLATELARALHAYLSQPPSF